MVLYLEWTNVDISFIFDKTQPAQSKSVSARGPETLLRHFHFLLEAPTPPSPKRKGALAAAATRHILRLPALPLGAPAQGGLLHSTMPHGSALRSTGAPRVHSSQPQLQPQPPSAPSTVLSPLA